MFALSINGFYIYIYKWIKFLVWNKIDKIINLGKCYSLQSYHSGWFTILELFKNKFNCNCCWELSLLKDICCIFKTVGRIYYHLQLYPFHLLSRSSISSSPSSIYYCLHSLFISIYPSLILSIPSPHLHLHLHLHLQSIHSI